MDPPLKRGSSTAHFRLFLPCTNLRAGHGAELLIAVKRRYGPFQNLRNPRTGHSTQKPVECMRRPIENNSSAGQAVYEPFCGSGTTIIAAAMTGRAATLSSHCLPMSTSA